MVGSLLEGLLRDKTSGDILVVDLVIRNGYRSWIKIMYKNFIT